MESSGPSLPETLRRLDAALDEHGVSRSQLLDPRDLAARTALGEDTVRALLAGDAPPDEDVNDRVRRRIRTLADAYTARTGKRKAELVAEVSRSLNISDYWARLVCDGKKVPNVQILHGLVKFFGLGDAKEAYFTDEAPDALNRELLTILRRYECPGSDPLRTLMRRYGVERVALRSPGHPQLSIEQFEELLAQVLRVVLPQEEGPVR
ncbi:hypothetical protein NX794_18030 [Streptomyces sp. LP11]|uniref:Transcriptional regulator n=1 Tax=Streptomyces pyxinicus TaxID=2970331 RepID=A0ABT2B3U4_9ACTN|nr:hypothetical protein [Streptomyces sp. LP11]MCS0603095.1 hypothetical protein [Streptomyces sp. LP11]